MKYSDDQILAYAERRVRAAQRDRLVVPITGGMLLVVAGCMIWLLLEKSYSLNDNLMMNSHFLMGLMYGMLLMMTIGIGTLMFVKLFRLDRGIERKAYELLVRLGGKQLTDGDE